MDTQHWLDELTNYALTRTQAKVYYNLVMLGRASYANLTKELGVHRSEIYKICRELKEKGIVTEDGSRPIQFSPMPPEDALKVLHEEQLKRVKYLEERMPKLIGWLNSQANVKKAKPSVLIIEDDRSVADSLSNLLKTNRFDVETAVDGSEALKKARTRAYDLALIDICLPDIEGIKLLKNLRASNPNIKEMILTGYPSIQNAIEALNNGADAYVLKPFEPTGIMAKIKNIMD